MEILVIISITLFVYILANKKRGWTYPTKEDIDWAEKHKKEIEENS